VSDEQESALILAGIAEGLGGPEAAGMLDFYRAGFDAGKSRETIEREWEQARPVYAWRRVWCEACERGDACGNCGRAFAPDETVQMMYGWGAEPAPVCLECAAVPGAAQTRIKYGARGNNNRLQPPPKEVPALDVATCRQCRKPVEAGTCTGCGARWVRSRPGPVQMHRRPCEACDRLVIVSVKIKHPTCSKRCAKRAEQRRRRLHKRGRAWGWQWFADDDDYRRSVLQPFMALHRKCGYCKEPMDLSRADRRYCSARCRQRAYRQRHGHPLGLVAVTASEGNQDESSQEL